MIGLTSTAVAAARSLSSSAATMSSLALPMCTFCDPITHQSHGNATASVESNYLNHLKKHESWWILRVKLRQAAYFFILVATSNQGPEHSLQIGGLSSSSDTSQHFQENEDESMRTWVLHSVINCYQKCSNVYYIYNNIIWDVSRLNVWLILIDIRKSSQIRKTSAALSFGTFHLLFVQLGQDIFEGNCLKTPWDAVTWTGDSRTQVSHQQTKMIRNSGDLTKLDPEGCHMWVAYASSAKAPSLWCCLFFIWQWPLIYHLGLQSYIANARNGQHPPMLNS